MTVSPQYRQRSTAPLFAVNYVPEQPSAARTNDGVASDPFTVPADTVYILFKTDGPARMSFTNDGSDPADVQPADFPLADRDVLQVDPEVTNKLKIKGDATINYSLYWIKRK